MISVKRHCFLSDFHISHRSHFVVYRTTIDHSLCQLGLPVTTQLITGKVCTSTSKSIIHHVLSPSIRKENVSNQYAYPIKNGKRGGGGGRKRNKVTLTNSRKDWAEFNGCINYVPKRPVIAMAITGKPHCLSLSLLCARKFA